MFPTDIEDLLTRITDGESTFNLLLSGEAVALGVAKSQYSDEQIHRIKLLLTKAETEGEIRLYKSGGGQWTVL